MSQQFERQVLRIILILFVLTGGLYATLTPVFEASDELWHYPMIQYLGNGNPLPVQVTDPALAGPWKQEASQPPLYYYVGAWLTFWIDTSDMPIVRDLNPHVDNGVVTPDGNINLAVHNNPDFNRFQGTLLAIRLVRLVSVLMAAVTVYFTYLIGKELAPDRPEIGLLAATLAGFTPMFLFISGAVNNDNLAIPLASIGMWLLIRMVRHGGEDASRRFTAQTSWVDLSSNRYPWVPLLLIGAVIGAAVLTKQGTIGLIPLAWGTCVIYAWLQVRPLYRRSETTLGPGLTLIGLMIVRSFVSLFIIAIPILIIAGWWYWRNIVLYGDLLGWSAFIAVLGERETPAPIAQLWDERWGFMQSYWGLFGGVNVPMSTWIYLLLNGLLILAIPGGLLYGWTIWRERGGTLKLGHENEENGDQPFLLGVAATILDIVVIYFPLVVALLFSGAIIYGLIQWATTTWSSQGRLVFTAMSALNLLWAAALIGWMPPRWARPAGLIFGAGMMLLGIVSPILFIRPAYQPPAAAPLTCGSFELDGQTMRCDSPDDALFSNFMRLNRYEMTDQTLQPGDRLYVGLEWETVATSDRDWSVFVHLVDPVLNRPIAQRDMYLGQGLLASSFIEAGVISANRYVLTVPEGAVSPATLAVQVGLFDFENGERLVLPNGENFVEIGTIALDSSAGDLPNPLSLNFGNELKLTGFELDPRRLTAGNRVEATFYWEALAPMSVDYTLFAQVVDPDTTLWAAVDLPQPTTTWTPGETVTIPMTLTIREDAPAGVYPLRIGVYQFNEEDGFRNLQRVTDDGRLTDDFFNLTQIRID